MRSCPIIVLAFLIILSCRDNTIDIDDKTVFRYNEHANITTLDPAFAKDQRNIWACNLIYNGLVKLDKDLKIIPDLAQRWEVSNDGLTYTFILKKNIYFHDVVFRDPESDQRAVPQKTTVTAAHFKYSIERVMDAKTASPGASWFKAIQSITATDSHKLIIKLSRKQPEFLGILTMKYASVVLPAAVNAAGSEYRKYPVGTGPFYLKRWEENIKLVLRRNKNYFEKDAAGATLPYLEAVAITFKNDKQSEFLEFAQGNLDFINALDPSYKDELLTTTGELKTIYADNVNLKKAAFLNTEYLGINCDSSSINYVPVEIRRAINIGFNRAKMIKFLRNNIGVPATAGFIPQGMPGAASIKNEPYNPTLAQQIINNYKSINKKLPDIRITTSANYLDLCEFIQKELQNIGLKTSVEVMPPSTLRNNRSNGSLQVFRSSWIADYPDAINYLSLFYSDNFTPRGSNYFHFKNGLYDKLYERAQETAALENRIPLYNKMDSIIITDLPAIPLYYDQSVRFISKTVSGLDSNPVNMLDLTRVKKINKS